MGVHGLWELLAPVGRRVSVETLAGKRLAVDASIWMIQFMKAMRDENGEMVRNGHLLGFFRRICKLLFLRTKPVFVFDGGTPALKRRTVVARRRQRENAQAKIRKTAEKLLLNHLKATRLKELAKDLENQRLKNDVKGKKVLSDQTETMGDVTEGTSSASATYNQEKLDEMLAASLAAEEEGKFSGDTKSWNEHDDGDEDEEMMLPIVNGKVDPAVLAALPPSLQLDLLVQIREKLMAENRQKYQKVKKVPEKFSELQIQAYLKTVAFRRGIDEVQKAAAGRGVGGVQTSRIASEANREYIFSSSFTGNKDALANGGVEENGDKQYQIPTECPPDSQNNNASTSEPSTATELVAGEPVTTFNDDVETYLDERGRVRVSRVRAMGIRMTRDLQRNLDLMKEVEQDKGNNNDDGIVSSNKINEPSILDRGASIEISFLDDGEDNRLNGDDELFASLVAGNAMIISSSEAAPLNRQPSDSYSDSDWEEGIIEQKGDSCIGNIGVETKPSVVEERVSDDSEVDWEEGHFDVSKSLSAGPSKHGNPVSKGKLEEETDLQEAIRRSLEDLVGENGVSKSFKDEDMKKYDEKFNEVKDVAFCQETDKAEYPLEHDSFGGILDVVEKLDRVDPENISQKPEAPGTQLASILVDHSHEMEVCNDELCEVYHKNVAESGDVGRETLLTELATNIETNRVHVISDQLFDASTKGGNASYLANICSRDRSHISDAMLAGMPDSVPADSCKNDSDGAPTCNLDVTVDPAIPLGEACIKEKTPVEEKLAEGFSEKETSMDNSITGDTKNVHFGVTEDLLEKEMMILDQECSNLGDEQRKLERNADCVSNEMFAECQELLQMFGLPYIIAPMEAEAQCAYMELVNLVDGVVTDDSDVFLFGARSVYKNIFDERKYVETYFMKDIETELGLDREKLIRMALLLGSDYTEGVSGIGIVNAVEVLNSFPEEDGLQNFREWVESPDPNIIAKVKVQTGISPRKQQSKVRKDSQNHSENNVDAIDENVPQSNQNESVDDIQSEKQIFMDKHRNVSKNWHIPASFPSEMVISAYASPQVDQSTEPFSWGKPDLFVLHNGIGIVNAVEVLNSFPEEDGLQNFREWVESPDPNIIAKVKVQTGISPRKQQSKVRKDSQNHSENNVDAIDENVPQSNQNESVDDIQSEKQIFMDKHRNVSKNWHIPASFPSEMVISAYASPQVDQSTEPFSWGKPDLFVLHKLCWEKFGWGNHKADELLLPVLKEYNKHETQLRLEAFYTFNERFAKIRSKRIKKAVKGITGNQMSELLDDAVQEGTQRGKRSKGSSGKLNYGQEVPITEIKSTAANNESTASEKTAAKQSRGKKIQKPVPMDVGSSEAPVQVGPDQCNYKGPRQNGRGQGRKQAHGVGRGRGRGRIPENHGYEISGTSSSDSKSGNDGEAPAQKLERCTEVRRSKRSRKAVNYANDGLGIDDDEDKSMDQDNRSCANQDAVQHELPRDRSLCGDATADFSGKNQRKAEDPSPGQELCRDYTEREVALCMDEIETRLLDSRHDNPTFVDECTEDYLTMGGGFCVEEDEKDQDHNGRSAKEGTDPEADLNAQRAQSVNLQKSADGSLSNAELNLESPNPKTGLSGPESPGDDTGAKTVKALRAMPILRKKRKLG